MGIHFMFFGVQIIKLITTGRDINAFSRIFPRVTMCDFTIRQMSNFHKYTVECTLPINLFNEKIFIFIWFWLVLITFLNVVSLIFWISSVFSLNRVSYVKKYLVISEKMRRNALNRRHMPCFAEHYLRQDGVFAIRMLSKNTNDVIVSEIVCKLWDHFILHHRQRGEFHRNHPLDIDTEWSDSKFQNGRPYKAVGAAADATTPTTPGNIFP